MQLLQPKVCICRGDFVYLFWWNQAVPRTPHLLSQLVGIPLCPPPVITQCVYSPSKLKPVVLDYVTVIQDGTLRPVKRMSRRLPLSLPLSIPLRSLEVTDTTFSLCSLKSPLKVCLLFKIQAFYPQVCTYIQGNYTSLSSLVQKYRTEEHLMESRKYCNKMSVLT